jgi:hypothetical protein
MAVAAAAGRQAATRQLLVGWLLSRPRRRSGALPLLLAEAVQSSQETADLAARRELWAASLCLWAGTPCAPEDPIRAPAWLQAATESLLATDDQLGSWLASLEQRRADEVLEAVIGGARCETATRLLELVWNASDARRQTGLAARVVDLIHRAQNDALDALLSGSQRPGPALLLLLDAIERAEDDDTLPPLLPQAQAIMRRLGERALRHDPKLLAHALAEAAGEKEQRRLVDRYLEGRLGDIEVHLQTIEALHDTRQPRVLPLAEEIARATVKTFKSDHVSLARGLLYAEGHGAPRQFCKELARALRDSVEADPPAVPLAPVLARALERADELAPRRKAVASLARSRPASGPILILPMPMDEDQR